MRFTSLGARPDLLQALDSRRFGVIEIARVLNIPPPFLMVLSHAKCPPARVVEEGRSGVSYGAATATPKAEPESWAEAAQWCLDRNDELGMLNDREREFVSDMAWKMRFRELTEKQASWLRSI